MAALPTLAAGLLPSVIATFHAHHPRINFALHDVLAEPVNLMVREGRADLGLSVPPLGAEDLAFEPVLEDATWSSARWATRCLSDRVMAGVGLPLDIICDASQIATVGRMVAAGVGISVLTKLSFRQIATHGIDHRPLVSPNVGRPLGIVQRRRGALSTAAAALREMIVDAVRETTA